MENRLLRYKNSDIAWYRFGSGPVTVVCFHGYGEDASFYQFLAKHAGNQYTFISIDLPFHGKTEWRDGMVFDEKDLRQVVEQIVPRDQKIMLMGFSLGGRIVLSLYQSIPGRVEKMVLLAPDGLKVNGWYWLATQTWLGNKFFAFTMKKPSWFFFQLKVLNKLKLVNSSIFKFVNYYIGDAEVRRLLYARWTTMRKLKPNLGRIKEEVSTNKTSVRLLYGKHDRIILPSVGKKFIRGIEENAVLRIIPSGHQVLHEKHAEDIVQALLH
jgi:pimeloyl-ACP methyl ester carboxylesterase